MNRNYDVRLKDKEMTLSAEELLTMFNRNTSRNAELLNYIGQKNLFGIIAKERNESVHSRFVAELLAGDFLNAYSRESTLMHFLDLLLYRAGKENKAEEVNEHLRKAVLTRSVLFEKTESLCELYVRDYQKRTPSIPKKNAEKDDRIDIYLKFKLLSSVAGRNELEIFIENKVNSSEFDSQTLRYYEACNNGGFKRPFQLFVYLTPQPVRDMDHYSGLDKKYRPASPHYIHISYQDILDYIIEPLLSDESVDSNKKAMLKEYVSCLELPAMPDSESEVSNKALSIMAISSKERRLVNSFMEDTINRRLINKAIETKMGEPLYDISSNSKLLNSTEAVEGVIQMLVNVINDPLKILRAVDDCNIVGQQNGSDPFIIYSPQAWRSDDKGFYKYLPYKDLYVYAGKVYVSIRKAFSAAFKDYKERYKKSNEELVQLFRGVYSTKGGGVPLVSGKKQKDNRNTEIDGIFVRANVTDDRLPDINAILEKDFSVQPIDDAIYMKLMQCNTLIFADVPVTENALPKEIDDLVRDVSGYQRVGSTDFFFRKDITGDRILQLNRIDLLKDGYLIDKCGDTSILLNFFRSRRNLILSVYKIMLEAESDNKVYKEKLSVYRKLLKP